MLVNHCSGSYCLPRPENCSMAFHNHLSDIMLIIIHFLFPPFHRIIKISLRHKEYKISEDAANQLHLLLFTAFGDNLLGPANPYVSRIRNYYIKEFLIKIDRNDTRLVSLKKFIKQQILNLHENKLYRQLIVQIDVDAL